MKLLDTLQANKAEVLLASLLFLILVVPIAEEADAPNFSVGVLALPVMISAVLHVSTSRVHCATAAIIALIWFCLNIFVPDMATSVWPIALYGLLLGFVAYALLGHIFHATHIDRSLIASAVTVYLLLGVIWGAVYLIIYRLNPEAFVVSNVDPIYATSHFLYYSYITLTTLGYGDFAPVSPTARILSAMEAVTGVLYTGVLIARLISLFGKDLKEK